MKRICHLPGLPYVAVHSASTQPWGRGGLQQTHYCKISTFKNIAVDPGSLPQAQSKSTSTKMSLFVFGRLPSSASGCGARRLSQGGRGVLSSTVIPLSLRAQSRCVGTENKRWSEWCSRRYGGHMKSRGLTCLGSRQQLSLRRATLEKRALRYLVCCMECCM